MTTTGFIILVILASLAIPVYTKAIERGKSGEAINGLKLIYWGETLYDLENENYYYIAENGTTQSIQDNLNIQIEDNYYKYYITGSGANFMAYAKRRDSTANDWIAIDEDENWSKGSDYPFSTP